MLPSIETLLPQILEGLSTPVIKIDKYLWSILEEEIGGFQI